MRVLAAAIALVAVALALIAGALFRLGERPTEFDSKVDQCVEKRAVRDGDPQWCVKRLIREGG